MLLFAGCSQPKARAVEPPPGDGPTGLVLSWSEETCVLAGDDEDGDGLDDGCELALARAFAPELVVASGGCDWDDGVSPARPAGGYYFAVQRSRSGPIRIAYLPAYYRDCGWGGAKCFLPLVDCSRHAGDSEALVLELGYQPTTGRWTTERLFLSAHCFGSADGDCRWYEDGELASFGWVDRTPEGAPVVWVAEGRHANYPSRAACERGHFFVDTCERNDVRVRFPVISARQNIGSRAHPAGRAGGCVGAGWSEAASRPAALGGEECFWSADAPFGGWASSGGGSTPYFRYLVHVAGF